MRISDWSSDVCSSDLSGRVDQCLAPGCIGKPAGECGELIKTFLHQPSIGEFRSRRQAAALRTEEDEALRSMIQVGTGRFSSAGAMVPRNRRRCVCGWRLRIRGGGCRVSGTRDRKSVVSGKSVSGRVDLGVGRSIKKKKK